MLDVDLDAPHVLISGLKDPVEKQLKIVQQLTVAADQAVLLRGVDLEG
jgi:hypothetical protein